MPTWDNQKRPKGGKEMGGIEREKRDIKNSKKVKFRTKRQERTLSSNDWKRREIGLGGWIRRLIIDNRTLSQVINS